MNCLHAAQKGGSFAVLFISPVFFSGSWYRFVFYSGHSPSKTKVAGPIMYI